MSTSRVRFPIGNWFRASGGQPIAPEPLPDDEPLSLDDDEPLPLRDSSAGFWVIVCLVAGATTLACRPSNIADAASIFLLVVLGIVVARQFIA